MAGGEELAQILVDLFGVEAGALVDCSHVDPVWIKLIEKVDSYHSVFQDMEEIDVVRVDWQPVCKSGHALEQPVYHPGVGTDLFRLKDVIILQSAGIDLSFFGLRRLYEEGRLGALVRAGSAVDLLAFHRLLRGLAGKCHRWPCNTEGLPTGDIDRSTSFVRAALIWFTRILWVRWVLNFGKNVVRALGFFPVGLIRVFTNHHEALWIVRACCKFGSSDFLLTC